MTYGEPFPDGTFAVRTPSGGCHLYFTTPEIRVPNSAGRIGPLIDVRSADGYVVAPGSRSSGQRYETTNPVPPIPLPAWLTELACTPDPPYPSLGGRPSVRIASSSAYADAALRDEAQNVANAPEGTRNDTLNRAAFNLGQLVAEGMVLEGNVVSALTEAAAAAGLEPAEVHRTIRSGINAGRLNPRRGNS